ncbi:Hypothetical predicted protein [Cloeon dipterum]|uniref:Uncharacterized protein n=1 Tax=Cloeon dipterum TaxID=197152 RepID=A0A8S1CJ71_9INSE|nr:Hypothetical predicted protein [Cloeon dipterum]
MVNLGMKVVGVSRKSLGAAQQEAIFPRQKGQTGEMFFIQGDVIKPDDVSRIIKWTRNEFGRTDVLVNAAGSFHNYDILKTRDKEKIGEMIEAKISGTLLFSNAVIVDMLATQIKNGHIITTSSIIGKQDWRLYAGLYIAGQGTMSIITSVLKNEVKKVKLPVRVTEIPSTSKLTMYANQTDEDIAEEICNVVSLPILVIAERAAII